MRKKLTKTLTLFVTSFTTFHKVQISTILTTDEKTSETNDM